jgi:hypothetical protein
MVFWKNVTLLAWKMSISDLACPEPWGWRHKVPPKVGYLSTKLHGVKSQGLQSKYNFMYLIWMTECTTGIARHQLRQQWRWQNYAVFGVTSHSLVDNYQCFGELTGSIFRVKYMVLLHWRCRYEVPPKHCYHLPNTWYHNSQECESEYLITTNCSKSTAQPSKPGNTENKEVCILLV